MRFEFQGELATYNGDSDEQPYIDIDEKVLAWLLLDALGSDAKSGGYDKYGKWRVTFEKVEDDE